MEGHVAAFRAKPAFARNADEFLLVAVLQICFVAMLQHLCGHRGATPRDAIAAATAAAVAAAD